MGLLKFEGKEYNFRWEAVILLITAAPILIYTLFTYLDWVWLHEITGKITIYTLNFISGSSHEIYEATYVTENPWKLRIFKHGTTDRLPTITFETMCTGIHAILMFVFLTLFTPHSTIIETKEGIWIRKAKAILATSGVFYIVNIMRMWLQLYLYSIGYEWEDIHYSISAASSFIAVAAIILLHKYVPEFILTILWIGDEIRGLIGNPKNEEEKEEGEEEEKSENEGVDKENISDKQKEEPKSEDGHPSQLK